MRLSLTEQYTFFNYLSSFVSSGIPLLKSLDIFQPTIKNHSIKKLAKRLKRYLTQGLNISNSLMKSALFPSFILNSINIAEKSGNLEESLERINNYLKNKIDLRREIFNLCFYPSLVFFLTFCAFIFLPLFIFPYFSQLAQETNIALPASFRFLTSTITFFKNNFYYFLFFLFLIFILFFYLLQKNNFKRYLIENIYRLPILGSIFKKYFLANFCESLSFLLKSGIGLVEGLKVISEAEENPFFKRDINMVNHFLKQGESIKNSLRKSSFFDQRLIEMAAVGEQTGSLSLMFKKAGGFYLEEFQFMLKSLFRYLEVGLILFTGVVVGLFIFLAFSPLLSILKNI